MKKVSILIPHFKTWRWTAICLWHFKNYGMPVDSEIIVCNNSPDHPSIRTILETYLGEGVTVVPGMPTFTSHGMGYDLAASSATGDYLFTSETDSFPIQCGWFDDYIKAVGEGFDLIGPEIPQSSGRYIHPAGALYSKKILDSAAGWQNFHQDWLFCPGAGLQFGFDKPYHVVAYNPECAGKNLDDSQIELWQMVGPFQEMRSFDEDDWATYPKRTGIQNFEPIEGKQVYRKIGYEAGQWLAYFAEKHGFNVLRAPVKIEWMEGRHGQQAAGSVVFDGFKHVWCGTVSNVSGGDIPADVLKAKIKHQNQLFSRLPQQLQDDIRELERKHA